MKAQSWEIPFSENCDVMRVKSLSRARPKQSSSISQRAVTFHRMAAFVSRVTLTAL